ncbi:MULTISPECIES: penicillin acylase family protein [unclassified Isoptericola]|uniref:penicillin acylase family protein n=1 Tax=unclassified Isoptericola TaxID=2623355 RepID=UPI0036629351
MSATATPAAPGSPSEPDPSSDGTENEETGPRPARRSRLRSAVAGVAVVVVLALVATTVFTVVTLRRPLPDHEGTQQVPGLTSAVEVRRDAQDVPQVYADTPEDLFQAQGYLQAQDRFFEMDYRRHVTAGRLAELVGDVPEAIEADKVTRTFGWRRVAEQEWHDISDESREYLQAYAQGVNAYLDGRDAEELGVEYTVLGATVDVQEPEPWDPVDSLAWLKAMAWDLRGNYDSELDRALAYSTLGETDLVDELFPDYDASGNHPVLRNRDLANRVTGDASQEGGPASDAELTSALTGRTTGAGAATDALGSAVDSARSALDAVPVLVGRGDAAGSNSWVVSGDHTASGKPMLANDPHLALSAPGIWSQVGLHCNQVSDACPFDVAGFSFAGFPGVIIGHNGDLAWGLTNMGADVTDFFIERVRGDTWLKDGDAEDWEQLDVRKETIRVAGGKPVDLTVRSTEHGPIVSDVLDVGDVVGAPTQEGTEFGEYAVALQWTALQPGRTADAVFAFDTAKDAKDIRAAAALFEVPAQSIVFATTDGHIGYQAPGRIPVRAKVKGPVPSGGTWPRPGWDPRYDWKGWVDPDDMPRALDPQEGFVVAANQAVLRSGTQPYLADDWDYGYRSERIRTLLTEQIATGRPFTVEDMNRIQNDDWSAFAEALVPALLDIDLDDSYVAAGQDLLADWDYRMDADSPAAAYFAAVWRNLLQEAFWDDLPTSMRPDGGSQWLVVVTSMLDRSDDKFWDDRTTANVVESRDEILTRALISARRDLTVELSKEPSDWDWGTLHTLRLEHPVLGGAGVPSLVRDLVNPDPVKMPGGSSIVNATGWDAGTGSFAVTTGPSMRMVVDMADLDASTWVTVTGTSGHPASSHYDDQLDEWAAGETFDWPFSREAVEESAETRATLVP